MIEDSIEFLHSLFERALEGKITYDELVYDWEKVDDGSDISRILFEDLAEGISHCPGYFTKPGVDMDKWIRQAEYFRLACDKMMLNYLLTHRSIWIKHRDKILEESNGASLQDAEKLIHSRFL